MLIACLSGWPLWAQERGEADPIPGKFEELLRLQRHSLALDSLASLGLDGDGVLIAVLDAGFKGTDRHPALQHLFERGQIVATRDFVKGREDVFQHARHGTEVLACIAGKYGEIPLGAAPGASFLLARTDRKRRDQEEEEQNWKAAVDWALQQGADIICTTLTYGKNRYQPSDMDGRHTLISRAAAGAVAKGAVVVVSMGNEGASDWQKLEAPADVPGVMSVGGSLPMLPKKNPFASVGPNAAGDLKPDLAAPAYVLSTGRGSRYAIRAGTSYAAPLVAGMVACYLQRRPQAGPEQVMAAFRRAGNFFPYYDYGLGNGLPQAHRLWGDTLPDPPPTFEVTFNQDTVWLQLQADLVRQDSLSDSPGSILAFHFENPQGTLDAYQEVFLEPGTYAYYFLYRPEAEGTLRIWWKGYLFERKRMTKGSP